MIIPNILGRWNQNWRYHNIPGLGWRMTGDPNEAMKNDPKWSHENGGWTTTNFHGFILHLIQLLTIHVLWYLLGEHHQQHKHIAAVSIASILRTAVSSLKAHLLLCMGPPALYKAIPHSPSTEDAYPLLIRIMSLMILTNASPWASYPGFQSGSSGLLKNMKNNYAFLYGIKTVPQCDRVPCQPTWKCMFWGTFDFRVYFDRQLTHQNGSTMI